MQVLKIKDVSHFYNGFAFKSKDYSETGDYIVRIGNVKESGIDLSNAKKIDISKQEKDLNNYLIKQNSTFQQIPTQKRGVAHSSKELFLVALGLGGSDTD